MVGGWEKPVWTLEGLVRESHLMQVAAAVAIFEEMVLGLGQKGGGRVLIGGESMPGSSWTDAW